MHAAFFANSKITVKDLLINAFNLIFILLFQLYVFQLSWFAMIYSMFIYSVISDFFTRILYNYFFLHTIII